MAKKITWNNDIYWDPTCIYMSGSNSDIVTLDAVAPCDEYSEANKKHMMSGKAVDKMIKDRLRELGIIN